MVSIIKLRAPTNHLIPAPRDDSPTDPPPDNDDLELSLGINTVRDHPVLHRYFLTDLHRVESSLRLDNHVPIRGYIHPT